MHLEWGDVDWERGVLCIRAKPEHGWSPKNNEEREVPMAGVLRGYLWERRKEVGAVAEKEEGGRYEHPPTQSLRRACRRAGMREIGWHVLRHTFSTRLSLNGATLYQVSRLLGHSSVRVTEEAYGHVAARDLGSVVELGTGGGREWESWDDGSLF